MNAPASEVSGTAASGSTASSPALRKAIYGLLIAVAAGQMAGRILAVNSVDNVRLESYRFDDETKKKTEQLQAAGVTGPELDAALAEFRRKLQEEKFLQRPFLSGNDRSRWCTVRSLVEYGTYEIDAIIADPQWDTIDMVQHKNRAGEKRLYSSKPPLLATLLAGPYWVVHKLSGGATLKSHPYEIGRLFLLLFNVLPMVVMFLVIARWAERYGGTDWGRCFVMAAATFATFLTTFAVVLNNHLFGAVSAAIAFDAALRIWCEGERRLRWFVVAGFFSAFAVTNELPALALTALVGLMVVLRSPRLTLLAFAPAAAVVAVAALGTNYVAHATFKPAYAHWSKTNPDENWYDYEYQRGGKGKVIPSYWRAPKGIDAGEPSKLKYTLHCLVGHHGIFSLTPVWLLSFLGMGIWIVRGERDLKAVAAALLAMSAVVFTFYIFRPEMQRNYGGMTSGLRWMFWFAPLWLLTMLPAADRAARSRPLRGVALVLLALSALSASFPTWNPWTQPWLTKFCEYLGWVKF